MLVRVTLWGGVEERKIEKAVITSVVCFLPISTCSTTVDICCYFHNSLRMLHTSWGGQLTLIRLLVLP